MAQAWMIGRTASGRTVLIDTDPYLNLRAVILIDGERVERIRCSRFRDGGTTILQTDKGTVKRPSPFKGGPDTLDGEILVAGGPGGP